MFVLFCSWWLFQWQASHATGQRGDHLLEEVSLFQSRKVISKLDQDEAAISGRLRDTGAAQRAQFLLRTTFGPTQESLEHLQHMSEAEWVADQMSLPVSSHREYFRQRINSRYVSSLESLGRASSPCGKMSRWTAAAFGYLDEGKSIRIENGQIFVKGVLRSTVSTTFVPSRWVAYEGFSGYICTVDPEEVIGSYVSVSASSACSTKQIMVNPAVHSPQVARTNATLVHLKHGVVVAEFGFGDACDYEPTTIIEQDNVQYRFDQRFSSFDNLPSDPVEMTGVCAEHYAGIGAQCRARQSTEHEGVKTEVYAGAAFVSDLVAEGIEPVREAFPSLNIDSRSKDHNLHGQLSSRISGFLRVRVGGLYTFFLEGDVARVALGDSFAFDNAGAGLGEEKNRSLMLAPGAVAVVVENVGSGGVTLSWRGPDSGEVKEVIPTGSLFSLFPGRKQTQGVLSTVLYQNAGSGGNWWTTDLERNGYEFTVGPFFSSKINIPHRRYGFPGHSQVKYYFAARYSGLLFVATAGTYKFFITSDDGSRLWLGGTVVVSNGGWHGMVTKSATVELPEGETSIMVEMYNGRSWWGIQLEWQGPDSNNVREIVPSSAFLFVEPSQCFVRCGSVGEVGGNPTYGHHFISRVSSLWVDSRFDSRLPSNSVQSSWGKASTWIMQAVFARDQLRQRAAWALSQIFVVSANDAGSNDVNEMWTNFYDIFVRGAFGNFVDLLHAVVYSPVMGEYLTHTGSTSVEHNGMTPNENLAREIMQLFTVGTEKLNPDGSNVLSDGATVPSYNTDTILHVARIMTGFFNRATRSNVELQDTNYIDPMYIDPAVHDRYPKQDLHGNYFGEGLPLCDDLSPRAFLAKGTQYDLSTSVFAHAEVLVLRSDSQLFQKFCQTDASLCDFPASVVLDEDLSCSGDAECDARNVKVVQVGLLFYLVSTKCVSLLFNEGTANVTGNLSMEVSQGYCENYEDSAAQGRVQLDNVNAGDTEERRAQCFDKCAVYGGSGCELKWDQADAASNGCFVHTVGGDLRGSGHGKHLCWTYSQLTSESLGHVGPSYHRGFSEEECEEDTEIDTYMECLRAAQSLGLQLGVPVAGVNASLPRHCSYGRGKLWFNPGDVHHGQDGVRPICRSSLQVDAEGVVTTGRVSFGVNWAGEPPAAGDYMVSVRTQPVFDVVPTVVALRERLTITTSAPTSDCVSPCDGDVQGFAENGVLTVFRYSGVYYRNLESRVYVGDTSFRNPPVFLKDPATGTVQQVQWEVDALLTHLTQHENTGVFVGKKLIQRLGTSNPTRAYVRAVAEAFRTGTYDGRVYSGTHGDLAATFAAIALHPEASQFETGENAAYQGALREPFLKVVHLLRSMEYRDEFEDPVFFDELQNVIGQFPYQSPSVFNFFAADFELPMRSMSEAEPEPESEAETEAEAESESEAETESESEAESESESESESEAESESESESEAESESESESEAEVESEQFDSLVDAGPLLAPEFQIFTPQFFINYVRLMSNLISIGAYYPCGDNQMGNEVRYVRESGTLSPVCTLGKLRWRERATLNETVSLLDLLLTGQRMTPHTRETVVRAYESASEGSRLQAAQRAIVLSAEFNTFGNPLGSDTVRTVEPWVPPAINLRPYKALVYFHMGGGADTHNLVVPMSCEIYDEYVEARTNLALTPEEVFMINATGQRRNCSTFGIHGALPVLKTLYDEGDAAFFVNVGGLVKPLTMGNYRSSQRCMGLYSHSAQTTGAQTLRCQESGTGPRGFGGRIADALAGGSAAYLTHTFSVGGTAVWPYGFDVEPKLVSDEVNSLEQPVALLPIINNITTQVHGNVFAEAYVVNFLDAVQSTESDVRLGLERASAAARASSGGASGLVTNYVARNGFQGQLKTVATFISMRQSRGAERDFFYVTFGGWDTHSRMKARTNGLFGTINGGLQGFVAEMKAQGVWDSVLFVSASEFARTLDSNGDGSDHAWGANHFIAGGALNGGRILNKYLEHVKPGSPRDLGRGRFIPEYPWESVAVPIAEWMGVEASQRETVFPNVGNFGENDIISASDLFVQPLNSTS